MSTPTPDDGRLGRLGRFCARRHWWVIGAWIVVLIGVAVLGRGLGGHQLAADLVATGHLILACSRFFGHTENARGREQPASEPVIREKTRVAADAMVDRGLDFLARARRAVLALKE